MSKGVSRAKLIDGAPDARDDELRAQGAMLECRLRDLAVELDWRKRVRKNEERRAVAARLARIQRQQAEARARWTPSLRVVEGGR